MQLVGIIQKKPEPYDYNGTPVCRVTIRYAGCTQTKTAIFIFYGRMAGFACTFTRGQRVRVYFDLDASTEKTYSRVLARSIESYEKFIDNNE